MERWLYGANVCSALARIKSACKSDIRSVGRACNPVKSKPEIWDSQAKDFVANLQRVLGARRYYTRDGDSLEFEMTSLMRCE